MKEGTRRIGLALFLGICLGAGGLGAIATTPEIDGWYRTVAKPTWNSPNSVFGPVLWSRGCGDPRSRISAFQR
ncbi:MAG: TspO/MBR family protein [Planctomycetaceae bacterium]|nr:TspO/MBR family protein [Planctomycetaceae bacterium]